MEDQPKQKRKYNKKPKQETFLQELEQIPEEIVVNEQQQQETLEIEVEQEQVEQKTPAPPVSPKKKYNKNFKNHPDFIHPKDVKQTIPKMHDEIKLMVSNKPTPILGKDKRVLLRKVTEYKRLFPEELKNFKIKTNPTEDDLKQSLEEMAIIVELGGIEAFLTDSIVAGIRILEVGSQQTNYDVTGASIILKQNPQFHNLCKQLYLKYGVFSAVPIELQMCMLLTTTFALCIRKNSGMNDLNNFLDEPM